MKTTYWRHKGCGHFAICRPEDGKVIVTFVGPGATEGIHSSSFTITVGVTEWMGRNQYEPATKEQVDNRTAFLVEEMTGGDKGPYRENQDMTGLVLRHVHSGKLVKLLREAEKMEAYETASSIMGEIDRRITMGYMKQTPSGDFIALPPPVPGE